MAHVFLLKWMTTWQKNGAQVVSDSTVMI